MAQLIASMLATGRDQVLHAAQAATIAGADWLELRLDQWPDGHDLQPLLSRLRLPVLVACRMAEDHGSFRGTLAERRQLLSHALEAGAQGVDLEHWETWTPSMGRNRLRLLVRSFHSFTGVPKELPEIHQKLFASQCTLAKIAVTAHDLADSAPVLDLLQQIDQRNQPTAAFAMGRTAWPTRVLAAMLGAPFVYASVAEGEETAPGQVPVGLLAGLLRARSIGGGTELFGLLGNPALHSLGPWLHNRALRRIGNDGLYLPFETSRPEAVLAMLPRRQLRGLSVTAPHKQLMGAQCHQLSDDAKATGVVNTVQFAAHGLVIGHNTDVHGVRAALMPHLGPDSKGRSGVVLGAGGAARAAAVALQELGLEVTMLARGLDGARTFAAARGVRLGSLAARVLDELRPAVVVQATPVGGHGRPDADERLLPEWRPLPGTVVLDMVYRPRWTRLLRDVQQAGGIAVPGLEMFLHQAAAQFAIFTGRELPADELRRFIVGVP